MYLCRAFSEADLSTVCATAQELFYMFPAARFPLAEPELTRNLALRLHPTVVTTVEGEGIGFANELFLLL